MRSGWILILIGFNLCWAGTYSAFKDLQPWLNSGQIATLRYGVALLMLLVCWPFMPGNAPRGLDLLKTAVMGLFVFVCAPRMQVDATQAGLAGDMSVLVALEPLVTTVGAAIFRVTGRLSGDIRYTPWLRKYTFFNDMPFELALFADFFHEFQLIQGYAVS